jgi:hypothetical protein
MTDSSRPRIASCCPGRTGMRWSAEIELTAFDLPLARKRLALVDRHGAALIELRAELRTTG